MVLVSAITLKPIQKALLAAIKQHDGRLSIKKAAEGANFSLNTAYHHVRILERLGLIDITRAGPEKILSMRRPISAKMPESGHEGQNLRKKIFDIVKQHDGRLSIKEIQEILGRPQANLSPIIDAMEFRFGFIYTQMIDRNRIVFFNRGVLEGSSLTEADCRLMEKFNLDILDFRILEAPPSDEPWQELAARLKVMENQIKARVARSIPAKFGVVTFQEAQAIFLERRKS